MDAVERARALVGTPFRPQGRSPLGLDCIGLVLTAFELPQDCARRDYRLRGDRRAELKAGLARHFRPVRDIAAGDVLLFKAGHEQLHLGVRTADGFVHAHAGIGRVVETPGMPNWPLIAAYRIRTKG